MKIPTYFSLLLLLVYGTFSGYAQTVKKIDIPTYGKGDTCLWYIRNRDLALKLNIPRLIDNRAAFYFRFWTSESVTDIWSNDGKQYQGQVISYINSYDDRHTDKPKEKKLHFQQVLLDSGLAKQIATWTKTVSSIPTDKEIQGWVNGDDGVTYLFESSTPGQYSFKTYWSPHATYNQNIPEAKKIAAFVDTLSSSLSLGKRFSEFTKTLSHGTYSNGSSVLYIPSHRQRKRWEKRRPAREYLYSIVDTLDKYLTDTLTKTFRANQYVLESHTTYQLTFSPSNRLVHIKPSENPDNFKQRQEIERDKKVLRKAFRSIRVDFIHSKVPYVRWIKYNENIVRVGNP